VEGTLPAVRDILRDAQGEYGLEGFMKQVGTPRGPFPPPLRLPPEGSTRRKSS